MFLVFVTYKQSDLSSEKKANFYWILKMFFWIMKNVQNDQKSKSLLPTNYLFVSIAW